MTSRGEVPFIGLTEIATLCQRVILDASWVLPALLSATLGLVAILIAQPLTHSSAELMASTRRVATAGSSLLGASAATTLLLSIWGAATMPALSPRLFGILVLFGVVFGLALWTNVLFFGDPKIQLQVAIALRQTNEAVLARLLPSTSHSSYFLLAANVAAITILSALVYFLSSLFLGQSIPNARGAVLVLFALATCYSLCLFGSESVFVRLDGRALRLAARTIVWGVLLSPVALFTATALTFDYLRPAALALLASLVLIVGSCIAPPTFLRAWTLQSLAHRRAGAYAQRQLSGLQKLIDRHAQGSQLLLP